MKRPRISIKIVDKNGIKIQTVVTRKIKRIYSIIKADKNVNCLYKLSIRYADGGTNAGDYENKKDLIYMLKAFIEIV